MSWLSSARVLQRLLLTAILVLVACDHPTDTEKTQDDPLLQSLVDLGFDPRFIQDKGNYFLVEGDITFAKEHLRDALPRRSGVIRPPATGPLFQYTTSLLVSSVRILHISVDLRQLAPYPEWQAATRAAMSEWNQMPGTSVQFYEPSIYWSHLDIQISTEYEPCSPGTPCTLASASFPNGEIYGRTIVINLAFDRGYGPDGQPTYSSKVFNMVHEFGHTIGFRHTNYLNTGCGPESSGAVHVPNTPSSGGDPQSVMNGCAANNDYAGFSYYDRVASRTVYRGYEPLTTTGTVQSSRPVLQWQALNEATSYNIYYVTRYYDGEIGAWQDETNTFVGSTTGTSFTDTSRYASSLTPCPDDHSAPAYYLKTVFPLSGETYGGNRVCVS